MSAEADFRAILAGHAPLVALVGNRIAQNVLPQDAATPYVAFTSRHDPTLALDGAVLATAVSFTVQCWAASALQADDVADAVVAALALAPGARAVGVVSRDTGSDDEVALHATILGVEWWT